MSNLNIKMIAEQAGVCKATVSRTLRTPDIVAPKTREKVMAVVEKLGYTPNKLGASLRQGKSKNIVVTIPDISNPYFSPIVRAIERVALEKGYSVLLGDTQEDPQREYTFGDLVLGRQADGIIISSHRLPFDLTVNKHILNNLPPIVSTAELLPLPDIHQIAVDNIAVGASAIEHLTNLGHQKIAIIAGLEGYKSTTDRLQGVQNQLVKSGSNIDPQFIYYGNYSTQSGIDGIKHLFGLNERPTAIFCFGDQIAIGAMHGARELGLAIPQDISIMGVDDIYFAKYCHPPLTTIAQPLAEIGEQSALALIDIIEGRQPEKPVNILQHQLKARGSTAQLVNTTT